MDTQSLSYGILSESNIKLTILNQDNKIDHKEINLEEAKDYIEQINPLHPQVFFYTDEANPEIKEELAAGVPLERFTDEAAGRFQSFASLKEYGENQLAQWSMINNLFYLENLAAYTDNLAQLWRADRKQFASQIWKFLRSALGASNLSFMFNYVDEKDKLSLATFKGEISPLFSLASQSEKDLFNYFKDALVEQNTNFFFDEEKNQFHLYYIVDKGPLLAWGEIPNASILQKSLIQGLINGLNHHLK